MKFALKIIALAFVIFLAMNVAGQSIPAKCKATTKAGIQCKGTAAKATGFCMIHNPNAKRCGAATKAGTPCKVLVKTAGTKCRHHQ